MINLHHKFCMLLHKLSFLYSQESKKNENSVLKKRDSKNTLHSMHINNDILFVEY